MSHSISIHKLAVKHKDNVSKSKWIPAVGNKSFRLKPLDKQRDKHKNKPENLMVQTKTCKDENVMQRIGID